MSAPLPLNATPDRPEFEVSVGGSALEPLVKQDVVELDLSEEVGRHARLTLLVHNWDVDARAVRHSDSDLFAPGTEIALRLGYHAKLEPVFSGVITALGAHFGESLVPTLRIEARSRSIQLAHPPRSRVLEDVNDGDVANVIAADYGLTADAEDGIDQPFVVIDGRSDWDYLTERATALGWVTYVRDTTLVFRPPADPPARPPELTWGSTLTELTLTQDIATVADPVTATGWDPAALEAPEGEADAGRVGTPAGDRPAVDDALGDASWPLREELVARTTPLELPELEQLAVGRATASALAHVSGRGATIGSPTLRADGWISLSGVGTRMSGPFYVTASRQSISPRGYRTEFQVGLPRPLLPPARQGAGRSALRLGIVEDLDDPEHWGRVKVATPWRSDAPEAVWARIATLDAGPNQGTWFVPDVGQEVVVGTIGGDDRHPVVLGALWNGTQSPPETMDPDANDVRAIVTRSGHKIRIDDGDAASIEVATAGGRKVVLSDGDEAIELTDPSGPCTIKLSADGIALTAGAGDITLSASAGKVIVDATGIEATSQGAATIKSSSTLEVKAAARLTLGGALIAIG
jgi:phage protein D/phage baseplate assembly protein gpV